MKTAKEIYKWLKSQNYQTEFGEQEYRMYYAIDMPKILEAYHESRMKEIPEITDKEIKLACPQELIPRISCWIQGAKWYREEQRKRMTK
jgi:hypothetical protein